MRANSLVGDLNRVLTMVSLVSWGLSTEATRLAFQATITFLLYLMCHRISLICARLNEQQRKPGITPLAGSAKMDAGASLPQASAASDDHAWMPSPARGFSVRGPTYHRDGRKVPSAVAFGRVVAMDTLRSPSIVAISWQLPSGVFPDIRSCGP